MMVGYSTKTIPIRNGRLAAIESFHTNLLYGSLIASVVLATLLSTVPDRVRRSYERARSRPHDKGVHGCAATLYCCCFQTRAVDIVLALVQCMFVVGMGVVETIVVTSPIVEKF